MKASGWRYGSRVRELFAARWWGCPTPSSFDALSLDERVTIVALYELSWKMDAVNEYQRGLEAEAAVRKPRGSHFRRGRH